MELDHAQLNLGGETRYVRVVRAWWTTVVDSIDIIIDGTLLYNMINVLICRLSTCPGKWFVQRCVTQGGVAHRDILHRSHLAATKLLLLHKYGAEHILVIMTLVDDSERPCTISCFYS